MPFCSQCGNQVGDRDRFCAKCGASQPSGTGPAGADLRGLDSLNPKTASILCYIPGLGWIVGIATLSAAMTSAVTLTLFAMASVAPCSIIMLAPRRCMTWV